MDAALEDAMAAWSVINFPDKCHSYDNFLKKFIEPSRVTLVFLSPFYNQMNIFNLNRKVSVPLLRYTSYMN